ncbi:MAG: xanthine phosphoribosyltransferase [Bacillales bacterium]|jgi:xanthine phosphoribosyltransferase|nr:xanthine phosphoribosyltransferase [Bacillales bacterium]
MENIFLKEKIRREALIIDNNIIKVDHFLNHQIDVKVLDQIASIFFDYFKNRNITKIVTIEASGIAIACSLARFLNVPVVFAKKVSNINDNYYACQVFSYTKQTLNNIVIDKRFLNDKDNVLIIDDFLANGQAVLGLLDLVKQAHSQIVGVGIVIEKSFQKGSILLKKQNIDLLSIIQIQEIVNNKIIFKGEI